MPERLSNRNLHGRLDKFQAQRIHTVGRRTSGTISDTTSFQIDVSPIPQFYNRHAGGESASKGYDDQGT